MSTANYTTHAPQAGFFTRAENWMDSKGKAAWIAATVLGFVIFWPIGLAILFYMLWGKKTCSKSKYAGQEIAAKSSGNTAFDAYKADTLQRLEEEQANFESFLGRLRAAKDKSEFDDFMTEHEPENKESKDSEK